MKKDGRNFFFFSVRISNFLPIFLCLLFYISYRKFHAALDSFYEQPKKPNDVKRNEKCLLNVCRVSRHIYRWISEFPTLTFKSFKYFHSRWFTKKKSYKKFSFWSQYFTWKICEFTAWFDIFLTEQWTI